mmetsp:Transcript_21586/g.27815  ORF Transcript_21586/g.27815 Transcript_21586/m.27815 type:complete len:208 (+) Transcript_21586:56-679(+)
MSSIRIPPEDIIAAQSATLTTSSMLYAPKIIYIDELGKNDIECSIHTLPKPLKREFDHVFGNTYLMGQKQGDVPMEGMQLLAIPTNQRSREDLVKIGDHIEFEKDRLLNVFMQFGASLCEKLRSYGFWADYIDPCSGLPMLTRHCNKVYSEVDGMEVLLGYRAYNAGFCKILLHPKWGSAVYPATIFAFAPSNLVQKILEEYRPAAL